MAVGGKRFMLLYVNFSRSFCYLLPWRPTGSVKFILVICFCVCGFYKTVRWKVSLPPALFVANRPATLLCVCVCHCFFFVCLFYIRYLRNRHRTYHNSPQFFHQTKRGKSFRINMHNEDRKRPNSRE